MEPESSLPCSQQPNLIHINEAKFQSYFLGMRFNNIFPSTVSFSKTLITA